MTDLVGVDLAVLGVEFFRQFERQGPHEGAAVRAGFVIDGLLLHTTELFGLQVGRMPVIGDAHGTGGAVLAAGGAQTAGVLPDRDGVAAVVRFLADVDGPGGTDMTAHAAAHAQVGVDLHPAPQALGRECFTQRLLEKSHTFTASYCRNRNRKRSLPGQNGHTAD